MSLSSGGVRVVILGFVMTPLALAALALRLWSRRIQRMNLQFNDYMAIIATVLTIGTVAVCLAESFVGAVGVHIEEIMATRPWVLTLFLQLSTPGQLLWAAANTSVKLSILSLYTVIFPSKRFCHICYGTMAVSVVYFLSVFLEAFVLCKPVAYNWDKTISGGECYNQTLAYLIAGSTNLVIDAWVVALPMPMLFGLRVSLLKKFGIASMFSLGILICVLSLLRVISILAWDLTDATYTTTGVAVYSILEPTLGVVNACLPTIKPAIRRLFVNVPLSSAHKSPRSTVQSVSVRTARDRKRLPLDDDAYGVDFVRHEDNIPLTTINTRRVSHDHQGEEDTITITREWEVSRPRHGGFGLASGNFRN
ncbi:hypothetical protein F5B20DRAFT_558382 [Whalleya microplaca]|nr:hypothetical protein F5B20DRAFT_558382 [Whalleya microplaca]